MMQIWKLLKLKFRSRSNMLHMWEDDYLMIELLPIENLQFIKSETKRINEFGEEHFNGIGFDDITPLTEKPLKTLDKKIPGLEVIKILQKTGLNKIEQVVMQGVGVSEGPRVPLAFGTNKFAVIINEANEFVQHIWITGHTISEDDEIKLKAGLHILGKEFNLVGVNWFNGKFFDLRKKKQTGEFIKNCCQH